MRRHRRERDAALLRLREDRRLVVGRAQLDRRVQAGGDAAHRSVGQLLGQRGDERVAPDGTVTEAFAWLATATGVGSAVGAALGGALADGPGPAAAFALAGLAGGAAALVAVLGARSLDAPAAPRLVDRLPGAATA